MMKKKTFVLFTKSDWNEPPRIRHQLAQLLRKNGHTVVFFQKPTFAFWREDDHFNDNDLALVRTWQALHHKLRIANPLIKLNAFVERRRISSKLGKLQEKTDWIIINFNYDYFFLRKVLPENKIITIINDRFWDSGFMIRRPALMRQLELTCAMSDRVLAVSYPLIDDLAHFAKANLFLPWSAKKYTAPKTDVDRESIIFWGYYNERIDQDLVKSFASMLETIRPQYKLRIAGPIRVRKRLRRELAAFDNIEFHEAMPLEAVLKFRPFAAIIPYRADMKSVEAVTLSNKAVSLLSLGLPLIVSGMKNFLDANFFISADNGNLEQVILSAEHAFRENQSEIEDFVSHHTENNRYMELMSLVETVESE